MIEPCKQIVGGHTSGLVNPPIPKANQNQIQYSQNRSSHAYIADLPLSIIGAPNAI